MKAIIKQEEDGGLSVYAPSLELPIVTLDFQVVGGIADRLVPEDASFEDYEMLAEKLTEIFIGKLNVGDYGMKLYAPLKAAISQAVEPGPGFDEPLSFEL